MIEQIVIWRAIQGYRGQKSQNSDPPGRELVRCTSLLAMAMHLFLHSTGNTVVARRELPSVAMAMHSCLHSTAFRLCPAGNTVAAQRELPSVVRYGAVKKEQQMMQLSRREAMAVTVLGTALPSGMAVAAAPGLPPSSTLAKLCDADCEKELENIPRTTTASGLQYKDIVVGSGDSPSVCFQNQVAANYVAMIPNGKVFDSSLEKGVPYIFRVGAEQVIKGLDEGILSMKAGGKRRLYIPGELAFPNGLGAARLPPRRPVVLDVCLIHIPGISNLDA